jgi:hypothetical protein
VGRVAVAVAQLGIGEPVFRDEVAPVVAQVAAVDPEHRELRAAVFLLEALEVRGLRPAGEAPRGPEVDQHPAPAVIGQRL